MERCDLRITGRTSSGVVYTCSRCARSITLRVEEPGLRRSCVAVSSGLPGTEIHRLLALLGVKPTSSCGCASLAAEWDRHGVEWCREHRDDVLVPRLLEAYRETDWSTVFAAAVRGATHLWLIRRLNPLRPVRSGLAAVVDEGIERAELASRAGTGI